MSVPKVVMPLCSECGSVSVLDPCRNCATPAELAALPLAPFEIETAAGYPLAQKGIEK